MTSDVKDAGPEQWFQCPAIHHVTRFTEDFIDVQFHSGVIKDAHGPIFVEFYQHVNVAFRAGSAPSHRTEHCSVCHTETPQIVLMIAERREHILELRSHSHPQFTKGLGTNKVGATL